MLFKAKWFVLIKTEGPCSTTVFTVPMDNGLI